jgi:hypothetical protein
VFFCCIAAASIADETDNVGSVDSGCRMPNIEGMLLSDPQWLALSELPIQAGR